MSVVTHVGDTVLLSRTLFIQRIYTYTVLRVLRGLLRLFNQLRNHVSLLVSPLLVLTGQENESRMAAVSVASVIDDACCTRASPLTFPAGQ